MPDETQTTTTTTAETPAQTPPTPEPKAEETGRKDGNYTEDYVRRLREEAKTRREAEAATAKERDDLKKAIAARERADLERDKKFEELADKERKRADDLTKEYGEKQTAADRRLMLAEAKTAAVRAGIIDPDDVKSVPLDGVRIEGDDVVGVDEFVAKLKESKKHWFAQGDSGKRAPATPGTPPPPEGSNQSAPPTDAQNMNDKDFAALKERLGYIRRV